MVFITVIWNSTPGSIETAAHPQTHAHPQTSMLLGSLAPYVPRFHVAPVSGRRRRSMMPPFT